MAHLSDKALLVQLCVSQWVGRKLDKTAGDEVVRLNGADSRSGRFNKALLPACNALAAVKARTGQVRKKFHLNTLPWGVDGVSILPSANYLSFMTEYRQEKHEWTRLVQDFLDGYEAECWKSRSLLGNLYTSADYPSKDELSLKFSMDINVMPVPTGTDFRVALSNEETASIRANIEEQVSKAQTAAMRDVWQRLYDHATKFAERLADPDTIFYDSMFENARETCDLLTRLNVTDDPDLEAMRQRVSSKLVSHHPDTVRNDMAVRRNVAKEAQSIVDAMGTFMGGIA